MCQAIRPQMGDEQLKSTLECETPFVDYEYTTILAQLIKGLSSLHVVFFAVGAIGFFILRAPTTAPSPLTVGPAAQFEFPSLKPQRKSMPD